MQCFYCEREIRPHERYFEGVITGETYCLDCVEEHTCEYDPENEDLDLRTDQEQERRIFDD